jgi:hypothetical protein
VSNFNYDGKPIVWEKIVQVKKNLDLSLQKIYIHDKDFCKGVDIFSTESMQYRALRIGALIQRVKTC